MICFGESFHSVKQSYEMDIFICYWDSQTQNVRVLYWGSEFLGHTTNNGLLNKIEDRTLMLIMKHLKQIMSPSLIQIFSHFIIVQLCNFHYFQIQCFSGSFLIENLFIIISANWLTDIFKYLLKIFCKGF